MKQHGYHVRNVVHMLCHVAYSATVAEMRFVVSAPIGRCVISVRLLLLSPRKRENMFLPALALVCLSACVSVCNHDN